MSVSITEPLLKICSIKWHVKSNELRLEHIAILLTDGWENERERVEMHLHVVETYQHQIKLDYSVPVSIVDGFQNQLSGVYPTTVPEVGFLYIDLLCFPNA